MAWKRRLPPSKIPEIKRLQKALTWQGEVIDMKPIAAQS
jgi:hypothetical protein